MGRVTKGERSGAARLIPRARASRTSQNVKSWKVARVGPVLPERAASEGRRRGGRQSVLRTGTARTTRAPSLGAGDEGENRCARFGAPRPPRSEGERVQTADDVLDSAGR